MDIKNTLEILELVDAITSAIQESKEDGKLDYWDAPKFLKTLPAAKKAFEEIRLVSDELRDLDDEETKLLTDKLLDVVSNLIVAVFSR